MTRERFECGYCHERWYWKAEAANCCDVLSNDLDDDDEIRSVN